MARSISRTEKRGRGRPRIDPVSIHLTVPPYVLDALDKAAADFDAAGSPDHLMSRPGTVRAILYDWLIGHGYLELPPAREDAN
jgi:hypothetical protein